MTPRQARTRARLLFAWVAVSAGALLVEPLRALGNPDRTDYIGFATAGRMVHEGAGARLYSLTDQAAAQAALLGHPLDAGLSIYSNPPLAAWLLQPIAMLSLRTGLVVMTLVSIAAIAVAAWALRDVLPAEWSRGRRLGVAAVLAAPLPLVESIGYGQWNALLLVPAVLAARRLHRHGDSAAAGLLLAAVAVKPQLVWLVLPVLLVTRLWRTAAGFVAGGAVWAATSLLIVGPDGVHRWLVDVLPAVGREFSSAGVGGLVEAAGAGRGAATVTCAVAALAALAAVWRLRARLTAEPVLAVGVAVALSPLCSPHAYDGDLAFVLVALAVVAARRLDAALLLVVAVGLAGVLDERASGLLSHLEAPVCVAALLVALLPAPGRKPVAEAHAAAIRVAGRPAVSGGRP